MTILCDCTSSQTIVVSQTTLLVPFFHSFHVFCHLFLAINVINQSFLEVRLHQRATKLYMTPHSLRQFIQHMQEIKSDLHFYLLFIHPFSSHCQQCNFGVVEMCFGIKDLMKCMVSVSYNTEIM